MDYRPHQNSGKGEGFRGLCRNFGGGPRTVTPLPWETTIGQKWSLTIDKIGGDSHCAVFAFDPMRAVDIGRHRTQSWANCLVEMEEHLLFDGGVLLALRIYMNFKSHEMEF